MIDIVNAKKVFKEYVSDYDITDGKIALKVAHILKVAELSKQIAISLNMSEEDVKLAELIGLLHDIGRFEQVRKFNTFNDKKSINHGEYGVKVLFEDGLIERFNIDEKYYKIIKIAILNHNRGCIEEGLTEKELVHAKIIRDSDKLDIFRVLSTDTVENIYCCTENQMQESDFSDVIVKEFKEDHLINYKNRETYGDIWISHMAYIFDFNFKNSYVVMKENDYLTKLYKKINFENSKTIEQAKEIFEIANNYMNEMLLDTKN